MTHPKRVRQNPPSILENFRDLGRGIGELFGEIGKEVNLPSKRRRVMRNRGAVPPPPANDG